MKSVDDTSVAAVEVLAPVMSEAEARQCIETIKGHAVSIRALLVDLEERRGFLALGYANMSACMEAEFRQSRPTLVKELKAGRIEKQILDVPIGTFLESHFRPLSKLKPEYYKPAFDKASTLAGDRPVIAKDLAHAVAELLRSDPKASKKGIVERLKERDATLPPIPYFDGDVVEIRAGFNPALRKHDGCWGIVTHVGTWSCKVHISVRNVNLQCLPDEMDRVDPKYTADILSVSQRIAVLSELDLDPVIWSILETLNRQSCFTQIQLNLLAWAEQQYGISTL